MNRRRLIQIISVLLIATLGFIGYHVYHLWSTANKVYESPKEQEFDESKPMNVLLLGIDEKPQDKGRADSIGILTLNPQKKTILLTNIPRDTYVTIPGKPYKDKINHSYAFGGVSLAKETVENFIRIPIHAYVRVNMPGMKTIVDELGGIDVTVPFSFSESGSTFTKGTMHLNGSQALTFARMRKLDRQGDLGRVKRHQEVIRAMIHKGTKIKTILNLDDILHAVGDNVKTDIHPIDALKMSNIYREVKSHQLSSQTMIGKPIRLHRIYYYQVSDDEVTKVTNTIRSFMIE